MSKIYFIGVLSLGMFSLILLSNSGFESLEQDHREKVEEFVWRLTLKECRSFGKCLRDSQQKSHKVLSRYEQLINDSISDFIKKSPDLVSEGAIRGTRSYSKLLPVSKKLIETYEITLKRYTLQLMDQRLHDEKSRSCNIS